MFSKALDKRPEAGYYLDALVAEHVLHWPVNTEFPGTGKHVYVSEDGTDRHAYSDSTEMWLGSSKYSGDGWIVANELGANGYLVAMYQDFGVTWDVRADYGDDVFYERSDNPMHALCLVALKTVGFTWPEAEGD